MSKPARLITIAFSHFCEKARWALDHTGVAYREDAYIPGLHVFPMRRAGGKTVPILETDDGVLRDSAKILAFADAHAMDGRRLYPTEANEPELRREVDAFERTFDKELGRAARLFGYFHALPHAKELGDLVAPMMTRTQRALFPWTLRLVTPLIRQRYQVNEAAAVKARETVLRVFADVSQSLGSKRYLVGDRFTAADLTFASLAAPSVMPAGHPAWKNDDARLPEPLRALVEETRATPAGKHVQRMYGEHRRA